MAGAGVVVDVHAGVNLEGANVRFDVVFCPGLCHCRHESRSVCCAHWIPASIGAACAGNYEEYHRH